MTTNTEQITIPAIGISTVTIDLVGDSPLIHHRWSEKAKKAMLDKQMKKAKQSKEAKDPAEDFAQSLFLYNEQPGDRDKIARGEFDGIRVGFPAVAFKAAAVSACRFADGIKMTVSRGAFHVVGDMVELQCSTPTMREDMVRVGMGTADLRYRAQVTSWRAPLVIRYNAAALSVEQIVNLFNLAGFGVGIGEWRPEKDGSFGMFHVATGGES